ncbi:uncharacterized protein LOC143275995 [Babylonia areolata]|uniref:uncharacterized protein LOC143275995 n=1 Tax=Babylonia areolata TaxID=304850 RepID=UPI003FD07FB2
MNNGKPTLLVLLVYLSANVKRVSTDAGCQPGKDTLLPVPGDCTKFQRCIGGTLMPPENCGLGAAFSEQKQGCGVHFNEEKCTQEWIHRLNALCQHPPPGYNNSTPWNVAHPNYCNGFIRCVDGAAVLPCEMCPPNTLFKWGTHTVCETVTVADLVWCAVRGRRMVHILEIARRMAFDCNPERIYGLPANWVPLW